VVRIIWKFFISGGMELKLADVQIEALLRQLFQITDNDRYPFSPRIRTLKEIRAKIRPDPARAPAAALRTGEQGEIRATAVKRYIRTGIDPQPERRL
jgi:hypothetical protein